MVSNQRAAGAAEELSRRRLAALRKRRGAPVSERDVLKRASPYVRSRSFSTLVIFGALSGTPGFSKPAQPKKLDRSGHLAYR
jgi:hypothetical protein